MCLLRINLPNLCPNKKKNHFDAVDIGECHSEEVMFLLTLSVYKKKEKIIRGLYRKLDWSNAGNLCNVQWTHDAVVYILSLGLGGGAAFLGGGVLLIRVQGSMIFFFFLCPVSH